MITAVCIVWAKITIVLCAMRRSSEGIECCILNRRLLFNSTYLQALAGQAYGGRASARFRKQSETTP